MCVLSLVTYLFNVVILTDIVLMKLKVSVVSSGKREHDRPPNVGVLQTDAVADLVCEGLQEVGPPLRVQGPGLGVVYVDVSNLGIVGVGQGATGAVKRIPVAVAVGHKVDRYVHLSAGLLEEKDIGDTTPVVERFLDGVDDLVSGQLCAVRVQPPAKFISARPFRIYLK